MTVTLYKGNRLPLLTDTITSSGTAVNLTGSTVTFYMRPDNSATLKVNGSTATIVSAAAGTISYAWAAADVDTVGDWKSWWTVSSSGKSQDTPEFDVSIIEHAPDSIEVPHGVGADGATTIYAGDSYPYSAGRQLQYELMAMDVPDLTGLTVTWRVAGKLAKTMTVVGEDAVYVELTSANTTAIGAGVYNFEIEATLSSGEVATLVRSQLTVLSDLSV